MTPFDFIRKVATAKGPSEKLQVLNRLSLSLLAFYLRVKDNAMLSRTTARRGSGEKKVLVWKADFQKCKDLVLSRLKDRFAADTRAKDANTCDWDGGWHRRFQCPVLFYHRVSSFVSAIFVEVVLALQLPFRNRGDDVSSLPCFFSYWVSRMSFIQRF